MRKLLIFQLVWIYLLVVGAITATAQVDSVVILNENFEQSFNNAQNTADWELSATSPINGAKSLKHRLSGISGASYLSFPTSDALPENGNITWRFNLKNGNWSTSADNRFHFYLMASESNLLSTSNNGYAIGVNLKTADKFISLYKIENGTVVKTMVITSFLWGASMLVGVEVVRDKTGNWTISIDNNGNFDSLIKIGNAFDNSLINCHFSGLVFNYTSTRAGLLWLDDLQIWSPKPNNLTSEITSGNFVIPEFLNSNNDAETNQITVFDINLKDNASGDKVSTRVKQITINQAIGNKIQDWTTCIGGANLVVYNGLDSTVFAGNISPNSIQFNSIFEIPDGQLRNVRLKIWFSKDLSKVLDLSNVQFLINQNGIITEKTGSQFNVREITSNLSKLKVDISAIKLLSTSTLFKTNINKIFTIELKTVDKNSNLDLTPYFIKISKISGPGQLTSEKNPTLEGSSSNGIFSISDLQVDLPGTYTISAISTTLELFTCTINVAGDNTSEILAPNTQFSSNAISSLINKPENPIPVFKVKISDKGGDFLPTNISQLTIYNSATLINSANWTSTIEGFTIMDENNVDIPILSYQISDTAAVLQFTSNALQIQEGKSAAFTFAIYLKNTKLIDHSTLQFKIKRQSIGQLTSSNTSSFSDFFLSEIGSSVFTIDVQGTKAIFLDYPREISVNSPFYISAQVVDINGNIDLDTRNLSLSALNQATGNLTSSGNLIQENNNGVFYWNNLLFNTLSSFNLSICSSGFGNVVSDQILVKGDKSSTIELMPLSNSNFIISSESSEPGSAPLILSIKISDLGSGDNAPTNVKQILIINSKPINKADWTDNIGGLVLRQNGKISPCAVTFTDDSLWINFKKDSLIVSDKSTMTLDVHLFLKANKKIADNKTLQFTIDPQKSITYGGGSEFAAIQPNSISELHTIEVIAKEIIFSTLPTKVPVNLPFNVKIQAIDKNGNLDVDYTQSTQIQLFMGNGTVTPNTSLTSNFDKGIASFSNLSYNKSGYFMFVAKSSLLATAQSNSIFAADFNSTVNQSVLASKPIISSLNNSPNQAIDVLKIAISDVGTCDGLPTTITKIILKNVFPENSADFIKNIGGIVLKYNNKMLLIKSIISSTEVEISLNDTMLIIPDGSTKELIVSFYLNNYNIQDNKIIQLYIDADAHGWLSSTAGSSLLTNFSYDIFSEPLKIEVKASQISTKGSSSFIKNMEKFVVNVASTDVFGNIDEDFVGIGVLSKKMGDGILSSAELETSFNAGKAIFNCTYNQIGEFDLQISERNNELKTSGLLKLFSSQQITKLVNDNFESSNLAAWQNSEDWRVSDFKVINGAYSLKHNQVSGTLSSIYHNVTPIILNDNLTAWKLFLKKGDFDFSSSSNIQIILAADNPNNYNGFALNISKTGDGNLELWEIKNGKNELQVLKDSFFMHTEIPAYLEIVRSNTGNWEIFGNEFGEIGNLKLISKSTNATDCKLSTTGLVYNYTSLSCSKFWVDDFQVSCTSAPVGVLSVKSISNQKIEIKFSSFPLKAEIENITNILLINTKGEKINIESAKLDNTTLQISVASLKTDSFLISIQKITASNGLVSSVNNLKFNHKQVPEPFQIVISEIMNDPDPPVALPNAEYIELYNTSSDLLFLSNWTLTINSATVKLPEIWLQPKEYIILTNSLNYNNLSIFGKTYGIASFPSLANTEGTIQLHNELGKTMANITYSDKFYNGEIKANGGWSLELIDPSNLSGLIDNWKPSVDKSGGTPCKANSVLASNPDRIKPLIVNVFPENNSLILEFSESMDSLSLVNPKNFNVNIIGNPLEIKVLTSSSNKIMLIFEKVFISNTFYTLTLNNIKDLSGNALENIEHKFMLPEMVAPKDLVINEILFNPLPYGSDYVEIYNNSQKAIDLFDLIISTKNELGIYVSSVQVSLEHRLIFPDEYVVITEDPEFLNQHYTVGNPQNVLLISTMPSLDDKFGRIALLDKSMKLIDYVEYSEAMHFEMLSTKDGIALERVNPNLAAVDKSNWASAAETSGFGTPTAKNSHFNINEEQNKQFTLQEQTFSPDNDGFQDLLFINYKVESFGFLTNIKIFDAKGRFVKQIANNILLQNEGSFTWDGIDENGRLMPVGIYIVSIELFNSTGEVKQFKLACVKAEKI